ncbi:MAG: hypothetical protein JST90_14760 [Bacteroidetes bacterium]|nr:hypothetical protein [Bacteroidota bacterium]
MKQALTFNLMILSLLLGSCKKDASSDCQWNDSLLDGKMYRVTRAIQIRSYDTTDMTDQYTTGACSGARISFSGGTATNGSPGCDLIFYYSSFQYSATVSNGQCLLNMVQSPGFMVGQKVSSYGCDSFTIKEELSGNTEQHYVTYTRQ